MCILLVFTVEFYHNPRFTKHKIRQNFFFTFFGLFRILTMRTCGYTMMQCHVPEN